MHTFVGKVSRFNLLIRKRGAKPRGLARLSLRIISSGISGITAEEAKGYSYIVNKHGGIKRAFPIRIFIRHFTVVGCARPACLFKGQIYLIPAVRI